MICLCICLYQILTETVFPQSLQKLNQHLTKEVIDGTIHCKPGAAELLAHEVYTISTNHR